MIYVYWELIGFVYTNSYIKVKYKMYQLVFCLFIHSVWTTFQYYKRLHYTIKENLTIFIYFELELLYYYEEILLRWCSSHRWLVDAVAYFIWSIAWIGTSKRSTLFMYLLNHILIRHSDIFLYIFFLYFIIIINEIIFF